ncbi:uncharacterized protein LOC132300493 isoform X2 [Cornus florida]|uniref:uncharacterized protein LOC132300493 isoform X2 n=1 Tax=Cornus florida TaxID=4283 RepID=UPI00289FF4CB|nr:uncharacterized protein LOC132300493 isoform X2 [Cornus florida]
MKRKRNGKCKPKRHPVVGAVEEFPNTEDHPGADDFENAEYDSRMEVETPKTARDKVHQQAGLEKLAFNVRAEDNLTVEAGNITTRLSRDLGSSNTNPSSNAVLGQHERTNRKEPRLAHQGPQYQEQELNAALVVIKKVMEMDAAEPFNVPVDPIALGIPDYLDIIETPMDFGTICSNLKNGVKYLNSKDVFKDVQHIWENCRKYNHKGHYVLELMKRVKRSFLKYWTAAGLYSKQPLGGDGFMANSQLPPAESTIGCSAHGHGCPEGPMTYNPSQQQHDPEVLSQLQLSRSYRQPCQTQQKPCQLQTGSVQPELSQAQTATNVDSAGHSNLPSPMESPMKGCTRVYRCRMGQNTENFSSQQNLTSQQDQLLQKHCQCQQNFSQPQPSQQQSGISICSAGYSCLPPPTESPMKHSTCRHRCPVSPMTDNLSYQCQDQTGPSQLQFQHPSPSYSQSCQPQYKHSQCHPSPGQPQVGINIGSAESSMRRRIHGSRCQVGHITDNPSHRQEDQIDTSQPRSHQPLENYNEPYQPQQSSRQLRPSPQQAGTDTGSADSSNLQKKSRGRGPTRCLDLWNGDGDRISVTTNELGQPIGSEAPKLTSFLGTIARNGHFAPLTYVTWRALPDMKKENMWLQVQSKFDIDPKSKSWVLMSIGQKWRDWKAKLKASRYSSHKTDEERLADRDERVLPDQWRLLILFWNSKEAKKRSTTNKANRARQKIIHTAGTKSFARVREEQKAKRTDGKEPSRAELFILTHTRKDGRPVNEASSVIISQLREQAAQQQEPSQNNTVQNDIFSRVMGQDRHGRVRTYGLGPSPSDLCGPKPSRTEALMMASEANAEVREMKERMITMEQTCAQMADQMAKMMSMMSAMQGKHPDEQQSNNVGPSSVSLGTRQGRTRKRGKAQNSNMG